MTGRCGWASGSPNFPLLRLFVAEAGHGQPGPDAVERDGGDIARDLQDELPYMQGLIDDFARRSRLLGVYVVDPRGGLLLRDASGPMLPDLLRRDAVARLAEAGAPIVLPPRVVAGHLVADLVLPIAAPQSDVPDDRRLVGALVMSLPVERELARALARGPLDAPGERRSLIVPDPAGPLEPTAGPDGARLTPAPAGVAAGRSRAYGALGLAAGTAVAVGRPVSGLDWTALASADWRVATAPLRAFAGQTRLLGLTLALLLATTAAGGWRHLESRRQRALATQYRDLAGRLEAQQRLLLSITDTVPDMIGLKDLQRRYIFANPALALAAGQSPAALVGRTDRDLFPPATAARFDRLDREALAIGAVLVEDLEVELPGGRRYLHIAEVPVAEPGGRLTGVIAVARDVTQLTRARRQRERLVAQTVEVLVRAIELADPYLLGHSFGVRDLAGQLAQELGLGTAATATVRLAASLSQVGKLFVPRELLTKPGRHTPEEEQVMRGHVGHALRVLEDVDLDLPVETAIAQMHERLEGGGYPLGLAGAAIGIEGRLLAVADVFCARTRPRAYRDAIAPAEALHHLRCHGERYDASVVAALAAILERAPAAGSAPEGSGQEPGAISTSQLGPLPIA